MAELVKGWVCRDEKAPSGVGAISYCIFWQSLVTDLLLPSCKKPILRTDGEWRAPGRRHLEWCGLGMIPTVFNAEYDWIDRYGELKPGSCIKAVFEVP